MSTYKVKAFIRSFLEFSHGESISDDAHAPGIELGSPANNYHRIRLQSKFGKITVLAIDGHLLYPYGREMTVYEVYRISDTLSKAKAAGVTVLIGTYRSDRRDAAILQCPGGYIAEIHSLVGK